MGFFYNFRISQLHFVYSFLCVHFDFVVTALLLLFLPISWSFLVLSYIFPLILISLLPSTCCGIWVPMKSTSSSLNNWKLLKFLLLNEGSCNPNCGWLHDIQGEFWLHCWVPESFPSCENPAIVNKKFNKKILYLSLTHNTLQELLGICKKRPSASYKLNCPDKITARKNIKIILPTIHNCFTTMVCHAPCRLFIHKLFFGPLGLNLQVWSELGRSPPFWPLRALTLSWSWAFSLVCEVAHSVWENVEHNWSRSKCFQVQPVTCWQYLLVFL